MCSSPISRSMKPRYLMGVGTPCNILEAVHLGVDFFDCVMPSRNARHGNLFTWHGKMNLLNERYGPATRVPLTRAATVRPAETTAAPMCVT